MAKCCHNHQEVTFRGGVCPVCQVRENLQIVIESL